MKVHQPIVFQGNLNKNRYFEGWYFKQVSLNRENVLSFIPGVALTKTDKHAFIQVINGITRETWNIKYPLSDFESSKNGFKVRIGNSEFSDNGFTLNIDSADLKVSGNLIFSDLVKFPSTWFSPGIMGWYSFVPFMECKHGIGSVLHGLKGLLEVNNMVIDFTGGSGYIEKDWGTSFPESWIWLHCNTFNQPGVSFTFSVAKIPWLGSFFIGHICFLYCQDKFYLFATYNKSEIKKLTFKDREINIEISSKTHLLKVKAVQNMSGELKAPITGEMNRIIKESIDSAIEIEQYDTKKQLLFSDKGLSAGLEIIEKILSYF